MLFHEKLCNRLNISTFHVEEMEKFLLLEKFNLFFMRIPGKIKQLLFDQIGAYLPRDANVEIPENHNNLCVFDYCQECQGVE